MAWDAVHKAPMCNPKYGLDLPKPKLMLCCEHLFLYKDVLCVELMCAVCMVEWLLCNASVEDLSFCGRCSCVQLSYLYSKLHLHVSFLQCCFTCI